MSTTRLWFIHCICSPPGLCQALGMPVIKVVTIPYSEMLWNKQWVEEDDNHISYCWNCPRPPQPRMYSYTEWWAISPSLAGSSWVISSHLNFLWSSRRLGLLAFLLPAHHFASFLDFATKLWFMFSLSVIGTDNNRCSLYVYWVVNIQNR